MEGLVIVVNFWQGKQALITGHTGFKGSWLTYWLQRLGSDVSGYALSAPTQLNHFDLLKLDLPSISGDLRDRTKLQKAVAESQPDIIFHLAAQPLVRYSYRNPIETFETNVLGTVNLLEVCRKVPCIRAIVIITTDKCYTNQEWVWGYRETDALGGFDPYSASKGCAELVTASYRNAFFPIEEYGRTHQTLIATCRSGNVIGGGDWGMERLIPDLVKAAAASKIVPIRNPEAVRPWQHVLEPLYGYLLLGRQLFEGNIVCAEAWNFGPSAEEVTTVREVADGVRHRWSKVRYELVPKVPQPHETHFLRLDCSKARTKLGWKPRWSITTALTYTVAWYRDFYESGKLNTQEDLTAYEKAQ